MLNVLASGVLGGGFINPTWITNGTDFALFQKTSHIDEIISFMDKLIKLSTFENATKVLRVHEGVLQLGDNKILLTSVEFFKYGIESIEFDMFSIGRKYVIDLKSQRTQMSIVFRSYFGTSNNYFNDLFNQLIQTIWKDTAVRITNEATDKLISGEVLTFGKCVVSKKGIVCNDFLISWSDLTYQKNYNKLTINSKANHKVWTNLFYLNDYNVDVLISILDWIYLKDGLSDLIVEGQDFG